MKLNMKTTLLITLATLLTTFTTNAQIKDGGFEHWDSLDIIGFRDFLPSGWLEVNNMQCQGESKPWAVNRTNDAHSGNFAIELKNIATGVPSPAMLMTSANTPGGFNNKIRVNARYQSLNGFFKYSTPQTDTLNITILMLHGDEFIGMGELKHSENVSNYTSFNIPIIYSAPASVLPDSAVIYFTAGSSDHFVAGTTLTLDDIAFGLNSSVADITSFGAELKAWPNPSQGQITVSVNGRTTGKVSIELMDITGKVHHCREYPAIKGQIETSFELSENEKGLFFLRVRDELGSKSLRFVNE